MKPDKVDATLVKRREKDARIMATARQTTAKEPIVKISGHSRESSSLPYMSLNPGSDTSFRELQKHSSDRIDYWSRAPSHSSEESSQWSHSVPENSDSYMRAEIGRLESQQQRMYHEYGAYGRSQQRYQNPVYEHLPGFREGTSDQARWPNPYASPYGYHNLPFQTSPVKREPSTINHIKTEPNAFGLQSDYFPARGLDSLGQNLGLVIPKKEATEKSFKLTEASPYKPEHEIMSEASKLNDASEFNTMREIAPCINKEIDLTTRSTFASNQTSVIKRNIVSRTGLNNHSGEVGRKNVLATHGSERAVDDNHISRGSEPSVSPRNTGVIKRRSNTGIFVNEQSYSRSYQPNPVADMYKIIQKPSYETSTFSMDPRSILYQYYNAKHVVDVNQHFISKGAEKVKDTEHEVKEINECQHRISKDEESNSKRGDQDSDIVPRSPKESHLNELDDIVQIQNDSETQKDQSPEKDIDNKETSNKERLNESDNSTSEDFVPLKKRQRMMEVPYAMGHALNKSFLKVNFTLEEEFLVIDHIVRIEKYQTMRFDFLYQNFPNYDKLNLSFITFTHMGRKIPFNKNLEAHLFTLGLEFTKQNTKQIFQEMSALSTNVRKEVLNTTYPALYVLFFSILEGNTREKTWKDQHAKTLQITDSNHERLRGLIRPLEQVRSISIVVVGRLLRDDKNLQALYHMLVMLTPSSSSSQETKV